MTTQKYVWCFGITRGKPGTNQTLTRVWSPAEGTRHSTALGQDSLEGADIEDTGSRNNQRKNIGSHKNLWEEKTFAVILVTDSPECMCLGVFFCLFVLHISQPRRGSWFLCVSFSHCMLWGQEREKSRTPSKETRETKRGGKEILVFHLQPDWNLLRLLFALSHFATSWNFRVLQWEPKNDLLATALP